MMPPNTDKNQTQNKTKTHQTTRSTSVHFPKGITNDANKQTKTWIRPRVRQHRYFFRRHLKRSRQTKTPAPDRTIFKCHYKQTLKTVSDNAFTTSTSSGGISKDATSVTVTHTKPCIRPRGCQLFRLFQKMPRNTDQNQRLSIIVPEFFKR